MGKVFSREDFRENSLSLNNIKIHLYNKEQYKIETEHSLYAEEVCIKCAQHLNIDPVSVYLFGLKTENNNRWINPKKMVNPGTHEKLYFRMRFHPLDSKFNLIMNNCNETFKYIYFQYRHDFINENFSICEISQGLVFGLAVQDMLIHAYDSGYKKQPKKILKDKKFKSFMPESFQSKFDMIWNSLNLNYKMKQEFIAYHNSLRVKSINHVRKNYVLGLKSHVLDNFFEEYKCINILDESNHKPVEIRIGYMQSDLERKRCMLSLSNNPLCEIGDVMNVLLFKRDNKDTWIVQLILQEGVPLIFEFERLEVAESFASAVDGLYRLSHDFYNSCCLKVEPPSISELRNLKCHGPIKNEFALLKLKKKFYDKPGYYILMKRMTAYDEFAILCNGKTENKKPSLYVIKRNHEGHYFIDLPATSETEEENDQPTFATLRKLTDYYKNSHLQLQHKVAPGSKEISNLLLCQENTEEEEETSASLKTPNTIPLCYVSSQIKNLDGPFGCSGYFTDVYCGYLASEEIVAVKQLRLFKDRHKCYELFFKDIENFFKMKSSNFLRVFGISFGSELGLILEWASGRALSEYLTSKNIVLLDELAAAFCTIASGLLYLEQNDLIYGNLRCQNIMVINTDNLTVKIGDPGLISLTNMLPFDHEVNKERLPWIAPELHEDLTAMTFQSDMYAYAISLWEALNKGCRPLKGKSFMEAKAAIAAGDFLPCPDGLQHFNSDTKELHDFKESMYSNILKGCKVEPSSRLNATQMLRFMHEWMISMSPYKYDYIFSNDASASLPSETLIDKANSAEEVFVPDVRFTSPDDHQKNPKNTPDLSILDRFYDLNHNTGGRKKNCVTDTPVILSNADFPMAPLPIANEGMLAMSSRFNKCLPFVAVSPTVKVESIARDRIELKEEIGKGFFGVVRKARYKKESIFIDAAVKQLNKDNSSFKKALEDLYNEMKVLKELKNDNIVTVYGICLAIHGIVLEFMKGGSLDKYLRNNASSISNHWLENTVLPGITQGMIFLSEKNVLHRDLAARNILLNDDYSQVKISDFGLAKVLSPEKNYYRKQTNRHLPKYWTAPECFKQSKYNIKADVWSFGILMWECYSRGKLPILFNKDEEDAVNLFFEKIKDGKRLEKPEKCHDCAYGIMKSCWQLDPDVRPTFNDLLVKILNISLSK